VRHRDVRHCESECRATKAFRRQQSSSPYFINERACFGLWHKSTSSSVRRGPSSVAGKLMHSCKGGYKRASMTSAFTHHRTSMASAPDTMMRVVQPDDVLVSYRQNVCQISLTLPLIRPAATCTIDLLLGLDIFELSSTTMRKSMPGKSLRNHPSK
jgi:hypothetical protein